MLAAPSARGQEIVPHWPLGEKVWDQTALSPVGVTPGQGDEEKSEVSAFLSTSSDPALPARNSAAPAPTHRLLEEAKFDWTYLSGGVSNGLRINNLDTSATLNVPLVDGVAPLLLTPGVAVHFWDNPKAGLNGVPDLPTHLYDLNLEIGWRPELARWLFADLAITPGVYSDFKDVDSRAFQMRGRALAIIALSEQLQFAVGGLYVNRNKTKFLPAGGVIWNPNEDTRLSLVFPEPKHSLRLATVGEVQLWGYLAGEFGGGRWSVERASGVNDSLDYSDVRISLGVETEVKQGLKGHVELGYVFDRRVNYTGGTPDYTPQDTVMLRAGVSY